VLRPALPPSAIATRPGLLLLAGLASLLGARDQDAPRGPEVPPSASEDIHRGQVLLVGGELEGWERLVPESRGGGEAVVLLHAGPGEEGGEPSLERGPAGIRVAVTAGSELQDSPEIPDAMAGIGSIRLVTGSPARAIDAAYPDGRPSLLIRRVWERHVHRVPVIALGPRASAAASAACIVEASEIDEPQRNPRTVGRPRILWGLGFFPWAMLETAEGADGSLERLMEATCEGRMRLSVFLPGEAALLVDVQDSWARAHGSEPVLVFDLKRARRSRDWLLGGRLSVLSEGDCWLQITRRVHPAVEGPPVGVGTGEIGAAEERIEVPRALDRTSLRAALLCFARSPAPRRVVLRGESRRLTFELDSASRVFPRGEGRVPTLDRVRFDLEWNPPEDR